MTVATKKKGITDKQAAKRLTQLGVQVMKRLQVDIDLKAARAMITAGSKVTISDIEEKIEVHVDALHNHATANRDRLTSDGEKQSADLETGKYSWLLTRHVEVDDDDKVVVRIQKKIKAEKAKGKEADQDLIDKLQSFLREGKVTLNRETMLLEENRTVTGKIRGVEIVEEELFTAEPKDGTTNDKKVRPLLQRVVG